MKTYVKTKEFGPVGGGGARRELLYVDPPLVIVLYVGIYKMASFQGFAKLSEFPLVISNSMVDMRRGL